MPKPAFPSLACVPSDATNHRGSINLLGRHLKQADKIRKVELSKRSG
jgi:hypothetical protein